ncbi:hypothetical protein M378DRAFT_18781 [Amanita muscaria Koide BX008]|uniref:Uncharacterized protein n=1 Tax=Amanita muscaria (strain Koide BX008) TaxID=946122 RepID=A0A0C2SKW2_AMAMK|nr:hypothetical protein M378DRAFT_18781 [Amanita muscaria Koide BX008]
MPFTEGISELQSLWRSNFAPLARAHRLWRRVKPKESVKGRVRNGSKEYRTTDLIIVPFLTRVKRIEDKFWVFLQVISNMTDANLKIAFSSYGVERPIPFSEPAVASERWTRSPL